MWNDPIVEEIRAVRNAHAKKFNYDLKAIADDLRKQQKSSGKEVVSLSARKPVVFPQLKKAEQPKMP